jgi:hypothetical protein
MAALDRAELTGGLIAAALGVSLKMGVPRVARVVRTPRWVCLFLALHNLRIADVQAILAVAKTPSSGPERSNRSMPRAIHKERGHARFKDRPYRNAPSDGVVLRHRNCSAMRSASSSPEVEKAKENFAVSTRQVFVSMYVM